MMTKEEFLKREKELFNKRGNKSAYIKFLKENEGIMDDGMKRRIAAEHYESHVRDILSFIDAGEDEIRRCVSNFDYLMQENTGVIHAAYDIRQNASRMNKLDQVQVYIHCIRLLNSAAEAMKKKDTTIRNLTEMISKQNKGSDASESGK